MNMRATGSYSAGMTSPTDRRIGDAFPIIEAVYKNLDKLKYIAENAQNFVLEQIEFRSNLELEAIEWRYTNYDWQVLCSFDELTGVDLDKIEETMLSLQEAVQDDRRLTEEARNQVQDIKQYLDNLQQTVINDTTALVQRAETASQNVDSKEVIVSQKHTEVLDTALVVQNDKDATEAAKNVAESARDAALAVAGPLYATEAEGRGAVVDGETFAVQGDSEVAAFVYRRSSASASTLIAEIPSVAGTKRNGLPFRGYLPAGSLNQIFEQGVYIGRDTYTYTDKPVGLESGVTFILEAIDWSGERPMPRFQQHSITLWNSTTSWKRRFDSQAVNPAAFQLEGSRKYLGLFPTGSLASAYTDPGIWKYTEKPSDIPADAPEVGFIENVWIDTGEYIRQSVFSGDGAAYKRVRFITGGGNEKQGWFDAISSYRGSLNASHTVTDFRQEGKYIYSSKLVGMPDDAPTSGMLEVLVFGDYINYNIISFQDPSKKWSKFYRVSTGSDWGWKNIFWDSRRVTTGTIGDLTEGNYLLGARLSDMLPEMPTGSYATIRVFGDFKLIDIVDYRDTDKRWSKAVRRSDNLDYGWKRLGAGGRASPTKTYACFGDSITNGGTYVDTLVADGFPATKLGFGGCMLSKHQTGSPADPYFDKMSMYNLAKAVAAGDFSEQDAAMSWLIENGYTNYTGAMTRLKAVDWLNTSVVTLFWGTNDYRHSVPLGTINDVFEDGRTFYGALNFTIQTLIGAYPHLRIMLMTPLWRWSSGGTGADSDVNPNASGIYLYQYADAIKAVGNKYKLPVLDLYRESGINLLNKDYMLSDGLHPGAQGNAVLSAKITGFIRQQGW